MGFELLELDFNCFNWNSAVVEIISYLPNSARQSCIFSCVPLAGQPVALAQYFVQGQGGNNITTLETLHCGEAKCFSWALLLKYHFCFLFEPGKCDSCRISVLVLARKALRVALIGSYYGRRAMALHPFRHAAHVRHRCLVFNDSLNPCDASSLSLSIICGVELAWWLDCA